MHCFELKSSKIEPGLRIEGPNDPRVIVTSDGQFYMTLSDELSKAATHHYKHKKCAPRVKSVHIRNGGLLATGKPTPEALVRIDLTAEPGTLLVLTANNDRGEKQIQKGRYRKTIKSFGPFPSLGIEVIGGSDNLLEEKELWGKGIKRVQIIITIDEGSTFRIAVIDSVKKFQLSERFITWNGSDLTSSSPRQKRPSEGFATFGDALRG